MYSSKVHSTFELRLLIKSLFTSFNPVLMSSFKALKASQSLHWRPDVETKTFYNLRIDLLPVFTTQMMTNICQVSFHFLL
jgi:hypothetical protein